LARTVSTRIRICIGLVLLVLPGVLMAQGSEDIPLGDNAYAYIDALLNRGALQSLSALERPYDVRTVVRALKHEMPANPSRAVRGYAAALRTSLQRYDVGELLTPPSVPARRDAVHYQVSGEVYGTAETSSIRDLMRANDKAAAYPGVGLQGAITAGPLTAVLHPILDGRLNADPEYQLVKPADAARVQEGYLDARWPIAELFVGREERNWGPTAMAGLMLGDYVYSYDHVYFNIGVPAVHFQELFTRLDTYNNPTNGDTAINRFFSIHRLATHIGHLEFAVQEAMIYAGRGETFDLHYINPFSVYTFSQINEAENGNSQNKSLGGQAAWRSPVGTFSGEVYVDDIQIDAHCNPQVLCDKPTSGGFTLTAEGIPLVGDQRLFASYTLVSNLSYRTYEQPFTTYTYDDISLGRGYTDYDEWKLGVDLAAVPEVPLRVYGAYSRQGQGDYRLPYPQPDSFPVTPAFLSGIVQHVYRLGVQGAASFPWLQLSGDVGVNHETNWQHVTGLRHTELASSVKVSLVWARIFGGTVYPPSSHDADSP
jgi:hypothetical protein